MARKRSPRPPARPRRRDDEALQGPPPREATAAPTDQERRAQAERARYTASGPDIAGGDIDADWQRADSSGEEAVGGTVATPDKDAVEAMGDALGVPRAPDDEVRTSREILEGRDRYRWEQEDNEP